MTGIFLKINFSYFKLEIKKIMKKKAKGWANLAMTVTHYRMKKHKENLALQ